MLKRLLVLAAAVGSLAAPLSAQTTTFFASGGPVTITPTGMGFTPFQFFADYLGQHRLIAESDGTHFTLDTKGSVGITGFASLGPLTITTLSPGATIFFTYVANGRSYSAVNFYLRKTGGYNVDYADYNGTNPDQFHFDLRGIASATGLQCPGGDRLAICSDIDPNAPPVTATPEPGTIALFATGLAGLIPVVIRRRRRAA